MIKYGNKMIANPGCYLIASGGMRGMALPFKEGEIYEEKEISDVVIHLLNNQYNVGNVFAVKLDNETKKRLVHNIFTNDDQIAIILNKDNSPHDEMVFELMQEWRDWFSKLIKHMKEV